MLSPDCQHFRETFSPQDEPSDASHRAECEACDTYARRLEDAAMPVTAGFSTRLGLRLAAIPDLAGDCDDVDRLYAAVRRRARPGETLEDDVMDGTAVSGMDDTILDHLDVCERCHRLYGCLEDALTEPPRPLPQNLVERLLDLGRRAPEALPVWVSDSRYAAAACYVLTALLMLLAGDASARFNATSDAVSGRATTWIEAGLDNATRSWTRLAEGTHRGAETVHLWGTRTGQELSEDAERLQETVQRRTTSLVQSIDNLELDPRQWFDVEDSTPQGEDDGRPNPDPTR